MRFILAAVALGALVSASPVALPEPQNLNWDVIDAAAEPVVETTPVTEADTVVANAAAVSAAAPSLVASAAVAAASQGPNALRSRSISEEQKRNACGSASTGSVKANISPDTSDAFLAYKPFHDAANNAATPFGYTKAFTDLHGSTQISGFGGVISLTSYDVEQCSEYCEGLSNCQGFNIYYERDPEYGLGNNACPGSTMPSIANLKCVRWMSGPLAPETATNTGETYAGFVVVISGSNGYNRNAPPPSQPNFNGPVGLAGAINAPNDLVTNTNTYIGQKYFSFGNGKGQIPGYDPSACTIACDATTAYDSRHPDSTTGKYDKCNFVVAFVLSDAGKMPQGMYCAMYTEAWDPIYATNYGQYKGKDFWSVDSAYSYTSVNYAYPAICGSGYCRTIVTMEATVVEGVQVHARQKVV